MEKKIAVQFDETETFFGAVVDNTDGVSPEEFADDEIADQEYKWGEQRSRE